MKKINIPLRALHAASFFAERIDEKKPANFECVHIEATASLKHALAIPSPLVRPDRFRHASLGRYLGAIGGG